jgi:predicted cation transporter
MQSSTYDNILKMVGQTVLETNQTRHIIVYVKERIYTFMAIGLLGLLFIPLVKWYFKKED